MYNSVINTSRGEFNVRIYGKEADPVLICLHGWPQTSYCWHHMAPFVRDHFIIAPDLRGMGDSNRSLDLDFYHKNEMGRDIFAIADAMEIDRFNLAGHDWGGGIAQEMVFQDPDRIQKLIVLNMIIIHNAEGKNKAKELLIKHLFRSSWYQFFMSIKEFPEALLIDKEDIWVRFFSRGISNPVPEDAILEYIRCYKIPHSITTASNLYRTFSDDRKRWKQFEGKKISVPTKIIHGSQDPVIINEYLIGVENCFSEVEVSKLKGGHFIVDEQPEAVGKLISDFIQEN